MKRIAVVGCGLRIVAFAKALRETYCNTHKIVALMDTDPGKMAGFAKRTMLEDVPQYTDFELMCAEIKPDLLIIGTIDTFHAEYIVRALDKKIGVISEKPLCTTQEQCQAIREACRRNPEIFAVTSHNSRYRPVAQTLKKVLDSGVIGEIQSVEYRELLDRIHGKSYFRRWNSRRKFSNGLQLHKSCHHFDRLNYLLNSYAVSVTADGSRTVYGHDAPHKFEGIRCHECTHKDECPDYFKFDDKLFQTELYTPDMCIYSPDIDIEDNFAAVIRFANGVLGTYSLCAHTQYEGEIINIEGETGRIEMRKVYYRKPGEVNSVHGDELVMDNSLKLFRFRTGTWVDVEVPKASGSHGGADDIMFSQIFAAEPPADLPTLEDGMQAVLTGVAAVESIQLGKKVNVQLD